MVDSFDYPTPPDTSHERHGNALPEHKVERIIQLDIEGLARVAIRERLDVSLGTITKYLRLAGRPLSRFGRKPRQPRANAAP